MRLLHLLHQYLPRHVGGVELNTHHLVRQQRASGHEVALFYPDAGTSEASLAPQVDEDGAVHFAAAIDSPSATARFAATFRHPALGTAFEAALDSWRPDVVHVQHLMGLPANALTLLAERAIPYLVTLHDYWWLCANAQLLTNDTRELCGGPRWWINCGRCALARAGLRGPARHAAPALVPLFAWRAHLLEEGLGRAAALTVPTAFTRALYHQIGLEGRIDIVPNGIPLRPVLPPRETPRDGLRLAYLGSVAPQKGVHLLVEALNQLPSDGVSLDVYGGLESFPEYVAQLQAAARHPGIRWHGRVPNDEVLHRLAQADVVVVPSIWYETAVLVIQEAFAVGVPVVASNLGALAERVRHGEDGLLFAPDDADDLAATLRRLLDQAALLPRLRAGIRPVHTIEQQAEQLEELYRRIVAERRA